MQATSRLIATPLLDVAVEEAGPCDGKPVILLHGWPDDPRTWDRLLPGLHEAGFRTVVPFLRGYGQTRFRESAAMRSGQPSALARDALQLADSLGLDRFAVVGHDWGARAAYVCACLAPERVEKCVALSIGWGNVAVDQALSMGQTQSFWYQWVLGLPRGEALVGQEKIAFTRHIWTIWNPGWTVSETEFRATAQSFENDDWPDIVLHYYRSRWGLAAMDPSCADMEARLAADPTIHVPTLVLHGGGDPCVLQETSEGKEDLFTAYYRRALLPGVGHFPQRQSPTAVTEEIVSFLVR